MHAIFEDDDEFSAWLKGYVFIESSNEFFTEIDTETISVVAGRVAREESAVRST